jgi:hypothetical protein
MFKQRDYLLMTVMHSGTRTVKAMLKEQGHTVLYQHCLPVGQRWIGKFPNQITTVRNPYKVAASWLHHNDYNRFEQDDWEGQWTIWKDIVTNHKFVVYPIESLAAPIVGQAKKPQPEYVDVPQEKVQFALDVIQSVPINLPAYTNPWSEE